MESVAKHLRRSQSTMAGKTDRLVSDFQTFVGDVEQVLKSATQLPSDGLAAARGKLEEKVWQAKAKLADAGAAVAETAAGARDRGEGYIRDSPWKAIGLAVAIGALFGVLLSRRS